MIFQISAAVHPDDLKVISDRSGEAERIRKLHDDQLEISYRNKWFKLFVPKIFGGLELSLPQIIKLEEQLSYTDGSTGWVVTLCAGAGWFIGFLDHSIARELFHDENMCIAGSGAVSGTAHITKTGFIIEGRWKYASGAPHATAFTMNCFIQENNKPLTNPDGTPQIFSFILKRDEVVIHDTWNSMGMIATGSHTFEVKGVSVPSNRRFRIDPGYTVLDNVIFKFPFLQLAETTLAANISGMTMRFIELARAILSERGIHNSKALLQQIVRSEIQLNHHRQLFFDHVETSWETFSAESQLPNTILSQISNLSQSLVRESRSIMNILYPLCGLAASEMSSEINRVWRNFHTAGQHSLFLK